MPAFTSAYSEFIIRLREVETILFLARQAARARPIPQNVARTNALCRSGVVLMSSHIEGYVEDLGEIALQRIPVRRVPKARLGPIFRYHLSRDLIEEMRKAEDPSRVVMRIDAFLQRDAQIWDSSAEFSGAFAIGKFLEDFSNPKHERIVKFFERFGYGRFSRDLGRRLGRDYLPCKNMIDQIVNQRNLIAHGDMVTTGTPTDLAEMLRLGKQYCRETDRIVGDWFKAQGCPVR